MRHVLVASACLGALVFLDATREAIAQESTGLQSQDRLLHLDRRIQEIGNELKQLQGRLTDGQSIVTYYLAITRELDEFYGRAAIFVRSCEDRRIEFEALQRERSPFLNDFRAGVERCRTDRAGLDAAATRLRKALDAIGSDIVEIKRLLDLIKPNMEHKENELQLKKSERALSDKLRFMGNNIDSFKSSPRQF